MNVTQQCCATLLSHWAGLDLFHAARKVLFIDRAGTNVQVGGGEGRRGEERGVEGRRGEWRGGEQKGEWRGVEGSGGERQNSK